MTCMKHFYSLLFILSNACFSSTVAAQCSDARFDIPSQVSIEGYEHPASLNGFGSRTKLLWDVYISALYLPEKSQDLDTILAMEGPKRLSIYFAHDVPKEKLIEGWQDGFVKNNTPAHLALLQQRLDESYHYLRDMRVGDVIHIDQHPSKGSLLWINGKLTHAIPGADYFTAVLKIWIGKNPAQAPLKDCLLGLS